MVDKLTSAWTLFIGKKRRQLKYCQQIESQLPVLVRFARGLVGNSEDAEDLVHDCCVKALGAIAAAQFDNEASLHAWLKRILVNTYRDQYRRSQRSPICPTDYHADSGEGVNVYELVASTEQCPLQCMQDSDSSAAIQQALSSLPPEVRIVSVLFLINELSYREIASITDSPLGTVMSRLARGRRLLREALSDFDPGTNKPSIAPIAGKIGL